MIWYNCDRTILYDKIWRDMTWRDMTWRDMIRYDMRLCFSAFVKQGLTSQYRITFYIFIWTYLEHVKAARNVPVPLGHGQYLTHPPPVLCNNCKLLICCDHYYMMSMICDCVLSAIKNNDWPQNTSYNKITSLRKRLR
jgi:hypothetical protein